MRIGLEDPVPDISLVFSISSDEHLEVSLETVCGTWDPMPPDARAQTKLAVSTSFPEDRG